MRATGARDLGLQRRSDLTGFNWADVPVVLVETGFLSNPAESRLLRLVRRTSSASREDLHWARESYLAKRAKRD